MACHIVLSNIENLTYKPCSNLFHLTLPLQGLADKLKKKPFDELRIKGNDLEKALLEAKSSSHHINHLHGEIEDVKKMSKHFVSNLVYRNIKKKQFAVGRDIISHHFNSPLAKWSQNATAIYLKDMIVNGLPQLFCFNILNLQRNQDYIPRQYKQILYLEILKMCWK